MKNFKHLHRKSQTELRVGYKDGEVGDVAILETRRVFIGFGRKRAQGRAKTLTGLDEICLEEKEPEQKLESRNKDKEGHLGG